MNNDDARRRNRDSFREEVRASIERANAQFQGEYGAEIKALLGLSREDIAAISPGDADLEAYDKLMAVVKAASRTNASQAALAGQIRDLGALAVTIASRVPTLAAIL